MLELRFDGTSYCGWQIQNNGISVQKTVIDALESVIGKTADGLHGCSRTDAGVHAMRYFCHFDSDTSVQPERIVLAMNTRLPDNISAVSCKIVDSDFHARYSAKKKTYRYVINNSAVRDPFTGRYEYLYSRHLNEKIMNNAIKHFTGTHDFSAFCSSGCSVTDRTRTIYSAKVCRKNDKLIIEISGDGFLYNMVRIIAGTLIYVDEGKIQSNDLPAIIMSGNRNLAGPTAPAHGLTLCDVSYEDV